MYSVVVVKKKNILGGHVYVVEELDEGTLKVHKLPTENEAAEEYSIDDDGVCTCKAGEFGADCKHVAMADGSLVGLEMPKRKAARLIEEYLDKLREQWPRAQIVSLLDYKPERRIEVGTALACGVLDEKSAEKLTIWGEYKGLLIRMHCFKRRSRYRRALRIVRQRSRDYEPEEFEVGEVGQTYGGDHGTG